jgi:hypothetical protein
MKDHDTRGYVGLTNACDLHQPEDNRFGVRMPTHSKLNDIRMESSKECQSDTVSVLNSRHGLQLGANLFERTKRVDSSGRIDLG